MTEFHDRRLSLAGIRIDSLERGDLIQIIDRSKEARKKVLILNHNLHSLYLYEANAAFRESYRYASYVYIDGMPVVWLGRMAGLPLTASHRITLLDSFDAILQDAARRGWRVFYLGSTETVQSKALAMLRDRHSNLIIGGRDGFFSSGVAETSSVINEINEFGADIVFVGMGMPKQEMWIAENHSRLRASAIFSSGGTLDYVAGDAYRPPVWAGRLGLYGVCRLFSEPRRLWRRYLLEPMFLIKVLLARLVRQRLDDSISSKWGGQESEEALKKVG